MQRVFVTNCDSSPGGGAAQMRKMLELYELSDKTHQLVDDPDTADFILICDSEFDDYAFKIRNNRLVRKYPNKCFILSNFDKPFYYARGILTSAEKSGNRYERFRSTSYSAYYDPYHNPYIHQHQSGKDKGEKKYLFSFAGRNSHPIREAIFKQNFSRKDILIKDTTKVFDLWSGKTGNSIQDSYYRQLLSSKFALCPRGNGPNSIRLFEAMKLGIAPIIISDNFILPRGPHWEDFAIFIKEENIEDLEEIVAKYEGKYHEMGELARENFENFFSDKMYFNYVIENIKDIAEKQIIPEVLFHYYTDFLIFSCKCKQFVVRIKNRLKRLLKSSEVGSTHP
ncbi:exostosin family protein [Pontibacter locisalis]|uniref:Exostosin family protein n=1 Tax=Pontibacter locisalis TaxID=1719035 RepID=A0ABW5IUE5_9BACT